MLLASSGQPQAPGTLSRPRTGPSQMALWRPPGRAGNPLPSPLPGGCLPPPYPHKAKRLLPLVSATGRGPRSNRSLTRDAKGLAFANLFHSLYGYDSRQVSATGAMGNTHHRSCIVQSPYGDGHPTSIHLSTQLVRSDLTIGHDRETDGRKQETNNHSIQSTQPG